MKVTEVFDSDLPGQYRICSHKIVFDVILCVSSVDTVCAAVLLHVGSLVMTWTKPCVLNVLC